MKKGIVCAFIILILLIGCESDDDLDVDSNVTTFSGTGFSGYKNSEMGEVEYSFPSGLTGDGNGNIFIADTDNHVIRVINPEGIVTNFAGIVPEKINEYGKKIGGFQDGSNTIAEFNEPSGVAVAEDGTLFVADSKNGAIRVISQNQEVKTLVENLLLPTAITLDKEGNIYVSETLHHRILKIYSDGEIEVFAGGGYEKSDGYLIGDYQDGKGEEAKFNEPKGLAIGTDNTLYVADSGNQRIRAISEQGEVSTVAGSVSEKIPGTNYYAGSFQDGSLGEATFNFPEGIAVSEEDVIYVADTYNHRIRMIDLSKKEVTTIAGLEDYGLSDGDVEQATFDAPTGLFLLDQQTLMVADKWNHSIRQIELFKSE